jgi:uncharacterized phiE125 gp8 family phage protein
LEPIVITEPTLEPVVKAEAKAHCRIDVDDTAQDSMLDIYITRARDYLEWVTQRTILKKRLQANFDAWPCSGVFELPWATPLISVVSVTYVDKDEVSHTWASTEYATSVGSTKKWGRVALKSGKSFPSDELSVLDPIRIVYDAGLDTSASPAMEADASTKGAILELVARFFDIPEAEMITDRAAVQARELQYGFRAIAQRLLARYEF